MPVIIIRPRHCRWCIQIYRNFKHLVDEAKKQKTLVIDLESKQAVQENILKTIVENPVYNLIFGTGHGSPTIYTAEYAKPVFTLENCGILQGREVYLHSCLTGKRLGPEMIQKGARNYVGFIIEWSWTFTENDTGGFKYEDPYDDPKAKYFFESANTYPMSRLKNTQPREAYDMTIDAYNYWIDYLFNSDIKEAGQIIGLLALDRDGTIILGETPTVTPVKLSLTKKMIIYSLPLALIGLLTLYTGKREPLHVKLPASQSADRVK